VTEFYIPTGRVPADFSQTSTGRIFFAFSHADGKRSRSSMNRVFPSSHRGYSTALSQHPCGCGAEMIASSVRAECTGGGRLIAALFPALGGLGSGQRGRGCRTVAAAKYKTQSLGRVSRYAPLG